MKTLNSFLTNKDLIIRLIKKVMIENSHMEKSLKIRKLITLFFK